MSSCCNDGVVIKNGQTFVCNHKYLYNPKYNYCTLGNNYVIPLDAHNIPISGKYSSPAIIIISGKTFIRVNKVMHLLEDSSIVTQLDF